MAIKVIIMSAFFSQEHKRLGSEYQHALKYMTDAVYLSFFFSILNVLNNFPLVTMEVPNNSSY